MFSIVVILGTVAIEGQLLSFGGIAVVTCHSASRLHVGGLLHIRHDYVLVTIGHVEQHQRMDSSRLEESCCNRYGKP